jgi:ribosomal protein S12 methylthiotransferase
MKNVALISLGCAKNLVDSEVMLGALKRSGYSFVSRQQDADIIIVNTCGFIQPARDEAERALEKALRLKRRDPRKKIVVTGCYVERDEARLKGRFPEVDIWTGVRSFDRVAEILKGRQAPRPDRAFLYSDTSPRILSTPRTWAYVKVSEGCSHGCGFCAIPLIKGPYVSRSMASVVREVRVLAAQGVREINLVSHDTTFYGRDHGLRNGLVKLIEHLLPVKGLEWIRFLYGYPEEITGPLLDIMNEPKVCRYLDIPFQHADKKLVRGMKRGLSGSQALDLLGKIRARVPGIALRTTLIVGFPGEGREGFNSLKRFVLKARFDHLGVFTYSPEKGTDSFALSETVSPAEKERRRAAIMAIQAELSLARNRSYLGRVLEVLVEGRSSPDGRFLVGRTRFQAPEVDGRVHVSIPRATTRLPLAPIIKAEIVAAGPYNLRGKLVP